MNHTLGIFQSLSDSSHCNQFNASQSQQTSDVKIQNHKENVIREVKKYHGKSKESSSGSSYNSPCNLDLSLQSPPAKSSSYTHNGKRRYNNCTRNTSVKREDVPVDSNHKHIPRTRSYMKRTRRPSDTSDESNTVQYNFPPLTKQFSGTTSKATDDNAFLTSPLAKSSVSLQVHQYILVVLFFM